MIVGADWRNCNGCSMLQPRAQFYPLGETRAQGECKSCGRKRALARREINRAKHRVSPPTEPARCGACRLTKPAVDFYPDPNTARGLKTECRICKGVAVRWARILKEYGLTREAYGVLLESQGGKCSICKADLRSGRDVHLDHSHGTGRVRALLCILCNTGLGKFHDDPALLEKAAAYLRSHGC